MSVHFSSLTDLWATPQDFFDRLVERFGPFDLDPCATDENAKCIRYFTKEQDGLSLPWNGRVFMNPPYGREIGHWMRKAYESSGAGATVVCLVPARTDTAWWHDYAVKGHIEFIRGRLKFGGSANSAPFPSALVIFEPQASALAAAARKGGDVKLAPGEAPHSGGDSRNAQPLPPLSDSSTQSREIPGHG